MFRIRRIHDDILDRDRQALGQVQAILREQFPDAASSEWAMLPKRLRDPLAQGLRRVVLVAENGKGAVRGFALMAHAPDLGFSFMDYLSAAPGSTGGGIGSALYERVRDEAAALGARGLFFECLSDLAEYCPSPKLRRKNARILAFYGRYNAQVVAHTAYETPLEQGDACPPHLLFDPLGREPRLPAPWARKVVRAILERKYTDLCPPAYVNKVVRSFHDDPVKLRPLSPEPDTARIRANPGRAESIALVVSEGHHIHHVRERGYVEAPVRIRAVLKGIEPTGFFKHTAIKRHGEKPLLEIHDKGYANYFKRVCAGLPEGKSIYPYVFPLRNQVRPPKELAVRAGWYCLDTFTPLNKNAYLAAREAADCAQTAASLLLGGTRLAYALVRPPGHHAEIRAFGGFCYFNNSALAANLLAKAGKTAVLDLDYHHGNGTQEIFYERDDVLTISIHGHPSFAYPYFTGYAEERGRDKGTGFNRNYPLAEKATPRDHFRSLEQALAKIKRFRPLFLVLALGLDTASGDPTGTWELRAKDFKNMGRAIGELGLPTVVVQEGGYRVPSLGDNARAFFTGLRETLLARP